MHNKIHYLCLKTCLVCLLGCDSHHSVMDQKKPTTSPVELADHHIHHMSNYHLSYQKPGANIRLSHNYDGQTAVGETETIELTFTEQYSSGQMYVRLKPDAPLSIEPAVEDFVFSLEDFNSHSIQLSISAKSAGKHLLNIFASVMDNSGKPRNRIMAVAFYVGDNNQRQSKPQPPEPTDRVIILPSQESGS